MRTHCHTDQGDSTACIYIHVRIYVYMYIHINKLISLFTYMQVKVASLLAATPMKKSQKSALLSRSADKHKGER